MYNVRLKAFQGPLDLLLFFIRRDELDIHDIPIARITDEYLEYVKLIEQIDLDGAAEFIYMAAVLIGIKTKMLLPRQEVDEQGQPVDPREELVKRLLEYKQIREASEKIDALQASRLRQFESGAPESLRDKFVQATEDVEYDVSLFHLISALKRVLKDRPAEITHDIELEEYSVQEQRLFLADFVASKKPTSFIDLMKTRSRQFVISTFLAVLEMVREGVLTIAVMNSAEDFYLQKAA